MTASLFPDDDGPAGGQAAVVETVYTPWVCPGCGWEWPARQEPCGGFGRGGAGDGLDD